MSEAVFQGPLARCAGIEVRYGSGETTVRALVDVTAEVMPGERLALLGRSGSGKTTLLHVFGGLVEPTRGRVSWPTEQPPRIGFVFQGANLLPYFSALENVTFASNLVAAEHDPTPQPEAVLDLVGLHAKRHHLPSELSGGEAQRTAIARAIAQKPQILLCDEPTGHLDSDTARRVLDLIDALQAELGFAVVVATHDADVAARADRWLELEDGMITHQEST